MNETKLIWSIWTCNALLQWGLLALIFAKRGWRQHPAFAAYIAFNSCKTTLLMGISLFHPSWYFSINWTARSIGLLLMIAVLLEVFSAVFRPYSTLPEGTLRWFKITFGSLLLVTAVTAIYLPGPAPGSFVNTVMVVNRSASLIFCGAFSFTALFSSYYGIPWQSRTYGIGVGFLIYMSVDLFVASLSVMYGSAAANALRSVSMLGYSLSLIVWLNYFAKPEISPLTPSLEQLKSLRTALDYPARKAESFRETL